MICVLVFSGAGLTLAQQDIEGSKDHPLIKRYTGARISQYDLKEFDEYEIPLGKTAGNKFSKVQRVEGRITTIGYDNPPNRSVLEVFKNYEQALTATGFETLFSCANESCGKDWGPVDNFRDWGWGGYGQRQLTARLPRPEGPVYVSLHVQGKNTSQNWTLLVVVESKSMETGKVAVYAALADDLGRAGHSAVYGIYFDAGKADVKAESDLALKGIAKLLQQDVKLKLYVVGHTDAFGDLAANMDLSRRRAAAVMQALTANYGISPSRLLSDGVGPLAPVSSNQTEEGRAKNRRVELVAQ